MLSRPSLILFVCLGSAGLPLPAIAAAPAAEVAKKCMVYAYKAYPYKRPGSVRGSPDRQNYMRDCLARNGDVPVPTPPDANTSAAKK